MALNGLEHYLNLIGFGKPSERQRILQDCLKNFKNFRNVTESDISDMAEAFAKQTNAEGKSVFGCGRTKRFKGLMHWVHDHFCCDNPVSHNDFTLNAMNLLLEKEHL